MKRKCKVKLCCDVWIVLRKDSQPLLYDHDSDLVRARLDNDFYSHYHHIMAPKGGNAKKESGRAKKAENEAKKKDAAAVVKVR